MFARYNNNLTIIFSQMNLLASLIQSKKRIYRIKDRVKDQKRYKKKMKCKIQGKNRKKSYTVESNRLTKG